MGTEFGFSESYVGRLTFPSNKNLQLYYLSGYSEVSGGYCRRRGCCAANKLSIRNCISNCLKHTPQRHEIFFEQKSRDNFSRLGFNNALYSMKSFKM